MSKRDQWFRNTSWDPAVESAFFARLTRSRRPNAMQYVRIQAYSLFDAGERESAERLLDYHFAHCPDDPARVGAYVLKAQCREASGDIEGALEFYERAIERMNAAQNFGSDAPLKFARLVALSGISGRYDEALARVDFFMEAEAIHFPIVIFWAEGARALIRFGEGRLSEARDAARKALAAVALTHSGLPRHPEVGLVDNRDFTFHERVQTVFDQLAKQAFDSKSA